MQLVFSDFVVVIVWQGCGEFDVVWDFEVCNLVVQLFDYGLCLQVFVFGLYYGDKVFVVFVVWYVKDSVVDYIGVVQQCMFDFGWVDVYVV